jgi:hypothetical protein
LFFVVLPGTGQRASRPSGSKRPEAERMPRLRLTLQSRDTSKVFVNVTIGMGDFIHSSNAMARFVTNDMIKRVYIVPRFEKRFNLSISE